MMENPSLFISGLKVRVRLHYTWYLAFILITFIIVNQFPVLYELWERICLGLATSLLFFLVIITRHFTLSLISVGRRLPVHNYTLYIFGGACQLGTEENRPSFEALKGMIGILLNLFIVFIFYLVHIVLVLTNTEVMANIVEWLAYVLLMLSFFHIIPGFPLDGSRILLAALWNKTGDYYRSALITAWFGWVCGLALISYGAFMLAAQQARFTAITLALVGLALERAATQGRRQATQRRKIGDISASDILSTEYSTISQQLSVKQLVQDYMMVKTQPYFLVAEQERFLGIVTINDIQSIPQKRWNSTPVGAIMTPASRAKTAGIDQPGDSLLEQMERWGIEQMPVVQNDNLVGIVSRDDLVRLSRARIRLKYKREY